MKRLLCATLLLLIPVVGYSQFPIQGTGSLTAANASCLSTNCVNITLRPGAGSVVVQLTGTWTGTVQFEATTATTLSSATYSSIQGFSIVNGAAATSATGNGVWQFSAASLTNFRARVSAFSSGPIVVTVIGSNFPPAFAFSGTISGNSAASATGAAVPANGGYTAASVGGTLTGLTATNNTGKISLDVNITGGAGAGGTSSNFGSAFPSAGTAIGASDGTNMQGPRAFDADSGAGTQYVLGANLRKIASGGSVEAGTSSDPLRVDPTGTTTQPVSGTITANQGGAWTNAATQSGTWTVQPGNTANTTPWLATISQGGNSATVSASNALKVDGSAVTQPVSGTVSANASQTGTWTVQPGNTQNTTSWRVAQDLAFSVTTTMQSSATGNGNGTALATDGQATVQLTVNCNACSGGTTVNFEAQNDGSNFTAIQALNLSDNSTASSTTTSGITRWLVNVAGSKQLRARVSGYSAGSVTVVGTAVPLGGGGGAGGGSGVAANITQLGGNTINLGNGTSSTGTLRVTVASDSTGVIGATQSGTWTVQPGNTANTTAWLTNQDAAKSVTTTMQSAAVANGNGTVLATDGQKMAHITINCTVACNGGTTINFEGQNDGSNFFPILAIKDGSSTVAASVTYGTSTSTDAWVVPISGIKQLRARISAYSAGTITVTGTVNPMAEAPPVVNANITATGGVATEASLGASTDAAASPGGTGTVAAKLRSISSQTDSIKTDLDSLAGTVSSGGLKIRGSAGEAIVPNTDPCDGTLPTTKAISINADTLVISAASAKKTYICSGLLNANSAQETINIVEGTGSVCGTSKTALVGDTTDANGVTLAASGGGFTINRTIAGIGTNVDVCIMLGGTNRVSGYLEWVQQ